MRKLLFIALFALFVLIFPTAVNAQANLGGNGDGLDDGNGNSTVGVGVGSSLGPNTGLVRDQNGETRIKAVNELREAVRLQEDENRASLRSTTGIMVDTVFAKIGPCLITACDSDTDQLTALSEVSNLMAGFWAPQATTQRFVADAMNSAGLNVVSPAQAQGFGLGFASLDPILATWKVFRNVAYLFYVILFLVIGFMVMLRQKISSQAVVTVQQALPSIVISLIAVTFSYALSGLLIDLMYVVMYLILGMFSTMSGFETEGASLKSVVFDKDIFNVSLTFLQNSNAIGSSYDVVRDAVAGMFSGVGEGASQILGTISGLTFAVIFTLAILYGTFRLFFQLLQAYFSIIVSIVLAPIALMLGALPGNNAFKAWIKPLIANLAVFPAVLLVLSLSYMLIKTGYTAPTNSTDFINVDSAYEGGWLPPYLPGRGSSSSITVFLGLASILFLANVPSETKKALGGNGGIFEQFGNIVQSSLNAGLKGEALIPGVGISNPANWLKKQTGGFSGENILRKGALVGAGVGRGAVGGATAFTGQRLHELEQLARTRIPLVRSVMRDPLMPNNFDTKRGFNTGFTFAKQVGDAVGDQQINTQEKKSSGGH